MNITFCQGNKPCKETKKKRGARGWGEGGERAATVILEKGFRLISLTWVIIPVEMTLDLQETALSRSRVSLPPESGSRRPPLPAASPLGYLGSGREPARPRPTGAAETLGPRRPPGLLPAPILSCLPLLPAFAPPNRELLTLTALLLRPKG